MTSSSPSIGQRLTRLTVMSSATAVLLAGIVLFAYDVSDVRRSLVARLQIVSSLIASNVAAAVDFNDSEAASVMLASLKAGRRIEAAGIIVDGRTFASYVRPGSQLPDPGALPPPGEGRFTGKHLILTREIQSQGRTLGTLVIQTDLQDIRERLLRYGVILTIVFFAAVLVTTLISRKLQNNIADPILTLGTLCKTVSENQDYSLRAPPLHSVAEVEQLVATLNEMFEEVEASRTRLEQRVLERTRELAAANKELEAFSYSVSHDLRAPLRAIDGFSRTLIANYADKPLDERGLHFLDRVRAGTQKMGTLIDDMLHLARVTRSALEREEVDVTAIARRVALDLERRHPDRHVRFQIEEGMTACADSRLLAIVFDNLLGNAWKFTGKNSDARVEVGRTEGESGAAFFVRDNGAGFDMAYADKLFAAFQRLHDDSDFEGTGVGLATVQRIVHRHGGRIWAEAVEGKGATFFFTLGGDIERQTDSARRRQQG